MFISLYVHVTDMYIDVDICMDTVQTRLCMFTTTLHFPSFPISLVTPVSLCSAQEPLLLSCRLLGTSLFNWQTTQVCQLTDHTGTASIHIVQRSRGQRDVPLSCICISLSTTKTCWDNWLYHVHTLYIHCTYMVHTLTYYVHVHCLFNACTTEAISTVNSPVTPSWLV